MKTVLRFGIGVAALGMLVLALTPGVSVLAAGKPSVAINTDHAAPRAVEETTQ